MTFINLNHCLRALIIPVCEAMSFCAGALKETLLSSNPVTFKQVHGRQHHHTSSGWVHKAGIYSLHLSPRVIMTCSNFDHCTLHCQHYTTFPLIKAIVAKNKRSLECFRCQCGCRWLLFSLFN